MVEEGHTEAHAGEMLLGGWNANYTRHQREDRGAESQLCGQMEAPKCIQVT